MASHRAPDSYRSLYLSRAISPQIGLKLMAFDTTRSSTLNPSSFITLTFQKVGLCVWHTAQWCRAGWHIEDLGDPGFYSQLWRFCPLLFLCASCPTSSITAAFIDIKTKRLQIITPQCTFSMSFADGTCCFSSLFHRSRPFGATMQWICKQSCQWNNAHYLGCRQSNILHVWSVYFMKVN